MIEEWRDIPGYEGLYQVSDQGRVRNAKRMLKPTPAKNRGGYLNIGLVKNKERKYFRVHRLVWMAFVGPIPEGYEINHINQNTADNRLENLNLLTHNDNIRWSDGIERRAKAHYKPVFQYDMSGNLIREWESVKSIEDETGWKKGFIASCCRELPHFKTAYGFIWKYGK